MHLIADSGSSNTEWCLCEGKKVIKRIETKGFNPYYYSSEILGNIIKNNLVPELNTYDILNIYFYGSGCSTNQNKDIIESSLRLGFKNASIDIHHDLLGAARSVFGVEAGIACILGTGSNSAVYNGSKITHNIPSLGYFFGDEGSGSNLGKRLINNYLKEEFPTELKNLFEKQFKFSIEYILNQVYNTDSPVSFFASFPPFILANIRSEYMHNLVYAAFNDFFEQNICKYPNYKEQPLKFIGSIALAFSNILNEVASEFEIKIEEIKKTPMEGLISYHS